MSLDNIDVFCVVCGTVVPDDRKRRRSITCRDLCAKQRNAYLRAKAESRKCKYCNQPSTPEERRLFKQWYKSLKQQANPTEKVIQ
jgi:hypothetical protein